jgi:mono/diheme cytochrome c family protein
MVPRLRNVALVLVTCGAAAALLGCGRTDSSGLGIQPGPAVPEAPIVIRPEPSIGLPYPAPAPALEPLPEALPAVPPEPVAVMPVPVGMPVDVAALLQRRCASCHTYGEADEGGWGSVLDLSRMIDADIVVPGDPDASRLIHRVAVVGDMPRNSNRLGDQEIEALRSWIKELDRPRRKPSFSDSDVLDAISMDQIRLRSRSSDYRYISLAHFVTEGRPAGELEEARRALSLVVNSLSRRGNLVDLLAIEETGSILRLRLGELGWDEALWDNLTSFYPYCLRSEAAAHQALYNQLRTEAPVVRGDWFLATATRSPLYEQLIDLPDNLDLLAARLDLDVTRDINHPGLAEPDNLVRVGLRKSGVARENRLVERHLGGQGQYLWLTYDFLSGEGSSDLLANPLGPRSRDQQGFTHTFEHAGGEAIYTLPNGLQGYMLVDAAGKRLSNAPIEMVRDSRRRSGVVENGLSCLGCHANQGILRPIETDEVARYAEKRSSSYLAPELDEIEATYPLVLRPDVFALDAARYRASVSALPGDGSPGGTGEYTSLINLVGQYEANLGFQGALTELTEEPSNLRERLRGGDLQPGDVPRTIDESLVSRDKFVCVFRAWVAKVRPNAPFCARTFDAEPLSMLCPPSEIVP